MAELTIGIKELRAIMWQGNNPRDHVVEKVFSSPGSGKEMMMYGTVTIHLQRESVKLPWAGHMILSDEDGTMRIKDYHVYAVCSFRIILGL